MYCHAHRMYDCYACRARGFRLGNGFSRSLADIEAMSLEIDGIERIAAGDVLGGMAEIAEAEIIEDFFG
jgi:hypothetical protein